MLTTEIEDHSFNCESRRYKDVLRSCSKYINLFIYSQFIIMPRRKGWVWNFAKKSNDREEATCNICGAILCYRSSPSTMANHLKSMHQLNADNINESTDSVDLQLVEVDSAPSTPLNRKRQRNDSIRAIPYSAERQESISQGIARLISKTLPISLVSTEGF